MKVICLVDTRNHALFIDECVRSCLEQQVPAGCEYAVHVVDSGSTDDTVQKLAAYGERLTVHARENIGQSGAFDLCLALDADIFMFCDGDDRLKPSRLRRVVEVFAAQPDVVLVGNSITEIDGAGQALREVFTAEDQCLDARHEPDATRLYHARSLMGTSRMAVRKSALVSILPFAQTVLYEADELLFSLLPTLGKVCLLSERLTDYRLHGKNSYQSHHVGLEGLRRYRLVHEALLACLRAARDRRQLGGPYLALSETGLEKLCQTVRLREEASTSRTKAVGLVLADPDVLGFVAPSLPKRLVFSLPVLLFGLERSLGAVDRTRSLRRKPKPESARLL
jgi:glycosyltransferase involved in cell wall biosynthesis